jgi:hypothetical protein
MPKVPPISGKSGDDVRRNALVALGTMLMSGAIAWVVAISVVRTWSWEMRVLPPAAMFAFGAALVVWALRSSPNSHRAILNRAIREGNELLQNPGGLSGTMALEWQNATSARLREHVGTMAEQGLLYPPATQATIAHRIRAQVTYLEGLRDQR